MSEELKPCPFCGEKPFLEKGYNQQTGEYYKDEFCVICTHCNVGVWTAESEAIQAWNTRPTVSVEEIDMSNFIEWYHGDFDVQSSYYHKKKSIERLIHKLLVDKGVIQPLLKEEKWKKF